MGNGAPGGLGNGAGRFPGKAFARRAAPAAIAGLGLATWLTLSEHARKGAMVFPSSARAWAALYVFAVAAGLAIAWRFAGAGRAGGWRRLAAGAGSAAALAGCAAFLFSGAMLHPWTYYLNWLPHFGDGWAALKAGLPQFALLTAALAPLLARRRGGTGRWLWALLVAGQVGCAVALFHGTGGAALYRDDHPSFLFRFKEYASTFPQLLNYNPWWNGGAANAYCHSSGTGALGLPLLPLWLAAPVHETYTAGLALAYIFGRPLRAAGAARIMGGGKAAAACAGLLALGVSRHFFLWLLHYGTACAPMVAFFTLAVSACVYRVVWLDRREWWLGAALAASAAMLLQWPPGGVMALPVGAAFMLSWRRWTWKKIRYLAICAVGALLLAGRHLLVILLKSSTVVAHVMGGEEAEGAVSAGALLAKGFENLAGQMQEMHPVILFMGIAGLAGLAARSQRKWHWPILLGFGLIVGWGPLLKPNLELGRMAIPMAFAAIGPAAAACARLLRAGDWRLAPARAALVALLALGALNAGKLWGNGGHAQYRSMPKAIEEFAQRLREDVPEGGRVLFAGPTIHYFGHGHVAYLPLLAGREMMAVDYYHFPTTYVLYEYPPNGFNHTPEAVHEFMRIYNVTHVATFHERWKAFFRSPEGASEELEGYEGVNASVFRLKREPSQFVLGAGKVEADFSRLDVEVWDAGAEAAIAYNWEDGLEAPAPAELQPYDAGGGVRLIGIRPNGVAKFTIRYKSWL